MEEHINDNDILEEESESTEFVSFSYEEINNEIRRGEKMRHHVQKVENDKSFRCYTDAERQLIPAKLLAYLCEIENRGKLSSMQREWVLESVVEIASDRGIKHVSKPFFLAIVFIIQGVDGILTGNIPLSWKRFEEVSGKVH